MNGRYRYGGEVLLLPPEPPIIDPLTRVHSHQNLPFQPWEHRLLHGPWSENRKIIRVCRGTLGNFLQTTTLPTAL